MKKSVNKTLAAGLILVSSAIALDHIIGLPEFIHGFMMGLGVTLEIAGAFKEVFKKCPIKKVLSR